MTRFDPTIDELKQSLAWHVEVTRRLQGRLREAQRYVRAHYGDVHLMELLSTDPKEDR